MDNTFTTTTHPSLVAHKTSQDKLAHKWYEIPTLKASQDSNDLTEIEFFRDLGPLARLVDYNSATVGEPKPDPEIRKIRDDYLRSMDEGKKHNQFFLLLLFGMINVRDFTVTELMLPKKLRPLDLKKLKKRKSVPDPRLSNYKAQPLVNQSQCESDPRRCESSQVSFPLFKSNTKQQEPSEKSESFLHSDLQSADARSPLIQPEDLVFSHSSSAESNQLSEVSDELRL